jgi:hypothetical protein
MESTVSYIIIVVLVILSIIVYNYKKKKIRYYLLSEQQYPELKIGVNIQKYQGKIVAILINFLAVKNVTLIDLRIELISKEREFNFYSLKLLINAESFPIKLKPERKMEFLIPMEEFRTLLMDGEHPFRTFRFVGISERGQAFKSHEMGFDKKWIIYRPDTGKYN